MLRQPARTVSPELTKLIRHWVSDTSRFHQRDMWQLDDEDFLALVPHLGYYKGATYHYLDWLNETRQAERDEEDRKAGRKVGPRVPAAKYTETPEQRRKRLRAAAAKAAE